MKTLVTKDAALAAKIIKNGGVAAVPTETVYGLAANGLSEAAVERIFTAKGRPDNKPVSLFVTNIHHAEDFCLDIPEAAYILAERFWPGPLTMVLKRRDNVPDIITAGGDTVGVRCPDNGLTLEILSLSGVPITGTSANISGKPDAENAAEALLYFNGRIDCVVDGGDCTGRGPSTVIDMMQTPPRILRQGSLLKADIESTIGEVK